MKKVRNVMQWCLLGLLLGLLVVWPGEGLAQGPENDDLTLAVSSALIKQRSQISNDIGVFSVKYVDKWAFGLATIGTQTEGGGPDGYLFIAQESEIGWEIAIEPSTQFREWIAEAPDKLVSKPEKSSLIGRQSRGDGSAQLGLPWNVGETWRLTGGPHSSDGTGNRPWSALDFAGGSMLVRASADGTVYVGCLGAFIRVTHANGWQTGHYHIENPQVSSGQTVKRGDVLGTAGTAAPQISGCGGSATGAHVHYSLRRNNVHQEISGHDIGGWTVSETAHYDGCMTKNGVRKCDYYSGSGREIYNDGTVGSIPVTRPPETSCLKPFLRYYNTDRGKHFYTDNWNELQGGVGAWRYDGVAGYVASSADCHAPNAQPIYRLYHSVDQRHFYTANATERDAAVNSLGFTYERITGYVLLNDDPGYGTSALYRLFRKTNANHFYTTNPDEITNAINLGYTQYTVN